MPKTLSKEKISHTILEFGRELVLDLPEDHSREELESTMKFIVAVWNAVTLDNWESGSRHRDMLRDHMASAPREVQHLIDQLIERKQRHFGSDTRGVGRTWITFSDGQYVFGCDARVNSKNNLKTTGGARH